MPGQQLSRGMPRILTPIIDTRLPALALKRISLGILKGHVPAAGRGGLTGGEIFEAL